MAEIHLVDDGEHRDFKQDGVQPRPLDLNVDLTRGQRGHGDVFFVEPEQAQKINEIAFDWAMPVATQMVSDSANWVQALADVAAAVAQLTGATAPVAGNANNPQAQAIAKSLHSGERKAVLLGNAAAHHANASSLLSLAKWIADQTGATYGYLTEAANTVGAQWAKAEPQSGGLNAADRKSVV